LDNPDGELSILLVDDEQISALNRDYLHREGPTNVIAFPMQEGEFSQISPHLLGDVVISVETARREAEMAGIALDRRLAELLVHGVLHLFGYDHETEGADAEAMEERARSLLQVLGGMAQGGGTLEGGKEKGQ
jgi:probable rRNA maturation factor